MDGKYLLPGSRGKPLVAQKNNNNYYYWTEEQSIVFVITLITMSRVKAQGQVLHFWS